MFDEEPVTLSPQEEQELLMPDALPPEKQPTTLQEAIDWMLAYPGYADFLREYEGEGCELVLDCHTKFGMFLRNKFSLWAGYSACKRELAPLYYNLYEMGLVHPDDMSSILLEASFHHVHETEFDLAESIEAYRFYWKDLNDCALNGISRIVEGVIEKHTTLYEQESGQVLRRLRPRAPHCDKSSHSPFAFSLRDFSSKIV